MENNRVREGKVTDGKNGAAGFSDINDVAGDNLGEI